MNTPRLQLGCQHHCDIRKGFTLLELLTATVLMMIIVGIVLQLTSNILVSWNQAYSQLTSNFSARQPLDFIANDIEGAIIQSNNSGTIEKQWMEIGTLDSSETNSRFGRFDYILFYSPTIIRPKSLLNGSQIEVIPGDVTAACYRVAFKNPLEPTEAIDRRFCLYRAIIDPPVTFNDFLGEKEQEDNLLKTWKKASYSQKLLSKEFTRDFNGSGWNYSTDTMNLLSINIVALEFDPVYQQTDKPDNPLEVDRTKTKHIIPKDINLDQQSKKEIVAIDITMVVVSDEGETIIRNLDNAGQLDLDKFEDLAYKYEDQTGKYILGQHAELYKRRVKVNYITF